MAQTWNTLLFAHWPVPAETLRPLIPAGLTLETFAGEAWVGITPFVLTGLRPRGTLAIPYVSEFPEINVRTYVTAGGKPGVYFFSLDAASAVAVAAARLFYSLPYFRARFDISMDAGAVRYTSVRTDGTASFSAVYQPTGNATISAPATLAAWLTERYCLYAIDRRGILYRAEIHHPPWQLRPANADIRRNTMMAPLAFDLPDAPPLLHFADRLHVHVWAPEKVASTDSTTQRRGIGWRSAAALAAAGGAVALTRWGRRSDH